MRLLFIFCSANCDRGSGQASLAVSGLAAFNHFRASLGPVAGYRYLIRQKTKNRPRSDHFESERGRF